jgi:hypothetical protein
MPDTTPFQNQQQAAIWCQCSVTAQMLCVATAHVAPSQQALMADPIFNEQQSAGSRQLYNLCIAAEQGKQQAHMVDPLT